MASMNVSVPEGMRAWVQSRIDSGRYASASDYSRDLIRHDQELVLQQTYETALREGISDLEGGRLTPAEDVLTRLEQKYRSK